MDVLILLASDEHDLIVNEWCCYAMYCLSIHESCPTHILGDEILPCLVRLCKANSERTRYFCAAALAFISQIASVNSSSAIGTVVDMMRSESNPGKKYY